MNCFIQVLLVLLKHSECSRQVLLVPLESYDFFTQVLLVLLKRNHDWFQASAGYAGKLMPQSHTSSTKMAVSSIWGLPITSKLMPRQLSQVYHPAACLLYCSYIFVLHALVMSVFSFVPTSCSACSGQVCLLFCSYISFCMHRSAQMQLVLFVHVMPQPLSVCLATSCSTYSWP